MDMANQRQSIARKGWRVLATAVTALLVAGPLTAAPASADTTVNGCTIVVNPTPTSRTNCPNWDLRGVNFLGDVLAWADLSGADLTDANLVEADLTSADLSGADLTDANLAGANLAGANLAGANLTNANAPHIDLTDANLTGTELSDINLTGAGVTGANFDGSSVMPADAVAVSPDGSPVSVALSYDSPLTLDRTCDRPLGDPYPVGLTTVSCNFTTYLSGDSDTSSFTVTVNAPPTISGDTTGTFRVGQSGGANPTITRSGFPEPTLTASGLPGGLSFDAQTGTISGTPVAGTAGTHDVVITAANGIAPEATRVVTLTVHPPLLTVSADDEQISYGDAIPGFPAEYAGFVAGDDVDDLDSAATCTTTATANSMPGTYPISCTGASSPDYDITYGGGTLTVLPAGTTTTLSPAGPVTYGEPLSLSSTVTGSTGGTVAFFTGQQMLGTATVGPDGVADIEVPAGVLDAGSHQVLARHNAPAGYENSMSPSIEVVVEPATLTVTATDVQLDFGEATPAAFTPVVAGFVNGEDASLLTGDASCGTSASATPTVGDHAITCTGDLAAPNYTVTYGGGTMTVAPLNTEITLDAPQQAADDEPVVLTATVTASGTPTLKAMRIATALAVPLAAAPAVGTVTFQEAGTALGSVQLDANGVATLVLDQLTPGAHTFIAEFTGGNGYAASSTDVVVQILAPETPAPPAGDDPDPTPAPEPETAPGTESESIPDRNQAAPAAPTAVAGLPSTGTDAGLLASLAIGLLLVVAGRRLVVPRPRR